MKMRKLIIYVALLACVGLGATKYAGEIFQLSPGVLNQAMGNTGLTWNGSLSAGWWNPALLATSSQGGAELMRSENFEGLLQQNQFALSLGGKTRSAILVSHIGIDKIKLTRLENDADSLSNANRPVVWKTVSNNDVVLYGSIARSVKDKLHLGLTPKLAYRNLAENSGYGFGADLGLLWNAGGGFSAGANLRDFFTTRIIWENGTHEVAIPNLDLELAYSFALLGKKVPVHLALRGQTYAEGRGDASNLSFGEFSTDLHGGVLVQPIPQLNVMAGWDVDSFTAGLGVRWWNLGLDYAWRNGSDDALGYSQRVALSYSW